ncbi:MAG: methyltransferase [Gemmatimonadaceae bacterium]
MNSLLDEAWRLEPFVPPFRFSAFFSPEDTLLCVCAADAARLQLAPADGQGAGRLRIAELTSGSGLVGLRLLCDDSRATLLGLDIDEQAVEVSELNAGALRLSDRSRFARSDLWSERTLRLLETERPHLLVCNPPYVPEPPGMNMEIEAGAGEHGTAHLLRTLELARLVQPDALALSWCSLSDPASVVAAAESCGYELRELFVAAIADGEYSGSVHSYLRDLDNCYINEDAGTLSILASDGAARFGYLLFAGAFVGCGMRDAGSGKAEEPVDQMSQSAEWVRKMCEDYARDGLDALAVPPHAASRIPLPAIHLYTLDRYAELQLRVMLHGVPT